MAHGTDIKTGRRGYRVTVKGRLSERYARAFGGVGVEVENGCTTLVGEFDQAQLYGLLDRLGDFGLELLRVEENAR
jgi:hypothetical protein